MRVPNHKRVKRQRPSAPLPRPKPAESVQADEPQGDAVRDAHHGGDELGARAIAKRGV